MIHVRFYSLVLSAPLILFLSGIAVFFVEPLWLIGGLPVGWLMGIAGWFLQLAFWLLIACPKCRKSPYAYGKFGSLAGFFGKPIPDVICSSCSFDLRSGHDVEHSEAGRSRGPDTQPSDSD